MGYMKMKPTLFIFTAVFALAACNQKPSEPPKAMTDAAPVSAPAAEVAAPPEAAKPAPAPVPVSAPAAVAKPVEKPAPVVKTPKAALDAVNASSKVKAPAAATRSKKGDAFKYVILKTSMGNIVVRFFRDKAPNTVANFVNLAMGTKQWTNPDTGKVTSEPLYNGVFFHRVIPKFMIQTGDPSGSGAGKTGFNLMSEATPEMVFDRRGLVAMATAMDPNSGSTQFFITLDPFPHLNGKYAIFGEVVEGMEVAVAISEVPRDARDKPKSPVSIESVSLEEDWAGQ